MRGESDTDYSRMLGCGSDIVVSDRPLNCDLLAGCLACEYLQTPR
jgi:hypothetical protein